MSRTISVPLPAGRSMARMAAAILIAALAAPSLNAQGARGSRNSSPALQALNVNGAFDEQLQSTSISQAASSRGPTSTVSLTTSVPGAGLTALIGEMIHHTPRALPRRTPTTGAMSASLPAGLSPRAVQIGSFGYDRKATSILALVDPQIASVELPLMDAASKDLFLVTVNFFPSAYQMPPANSAVLSIPTGRTSAALLSTFRLSIDGISDSPRIATVQLPSITASSPGATPTFTPVVVSIATAHSAGFQQWLATNAPKDAVLTVLAPDLKTPLYYVKLNGLHIQTIANVTNATSQGIQRSKITMSVASVELQRP